MYAVYYTKTFFQSNVHKLLVCVYITHYCSLFNRIQEVKLCYYYCLFISAPKKTIKNYR